MLLSMILGFEFYGEKCKERRLVSLGTHGDDSDHVSEAKSEAGVRI